MSVREEVEPYDDTVFATAVYGDGYERFLAPHLECVSAAHPCSNICVLWRDIPHREIDTLARRFPRAEFRELEANIQGSIDQRIARKLHAWTDLCVRFPDKRLVLLDCDTLVVKSIDSFFGDDYDVLFTWKDEPFVINTGVMIFKNGSTAAPFLREWTERCERIASNPAALRQACNQSGAADQHALREMIGFANYDGVFRRDVGGTEFVLHGVPCRLLNETNSVPITDETHVIHYKAGWRPILFEGAKEGRGRSEASCREMLRFWSEVVGDAERKIARTLVETSCADKAERFAPGLIPYEERGILTSEMLAVCAVCDELEVDVIVESGRCRGQSTLTLARYFEGRKTRIISFELERDENATFAEQRLAGFPHVDLRYGDSMKEISGLLVTLGFERVAVLLDGPKGIVAVRFLQSLFQIHSNVVVGFIHDMRRETPQRALLESDHSRSFFTDDANYVERYGDFDALCQPALDAPITIDTWRPFRKGEDPIPSYGPTLAVVLPSPHARSAPLAPARPAIWRRVFHLAKRWLSAMALFAAKSSTG